MLLNVIQITSFTVVVISHIQILILVSFQNPYNPFSPLNKYIPKKYLQQLQIKQVTKFVK